MNFKFFFDISHLKKITKKFKLLKLNYTFF